MPHFRPAQAVLPRLLPVVFAAAVPQAAAALELRVVDQHGMPLQHAVVTAVVAQAARDPAATPEVAQLQQQFLPRVSVVRRGTAVRFPNRDTTQHHVYSFSAAKTFEIELYKGDSPAPVLFDKAGIVALGCNIHDWMLGYVFVSDDDVFDVSAADGAVHLRATLPAIERLTVWHPAAADGAPRTIAADALEVAADGSVQLAVVTAPVDPLAFEIDPLQHLFGDDAR